MWTHVIASPEIDGCVLDIDFLKWRMTNGLTKLNLHAWVLSKYTEGTVEKIA